MTETKPQVGEVEPSDLERCQELFDFLQGNVPEGYRLQKESVPQLTAEQAWTVIWYLGNQYWEVPDTIERCDICGDLYDSCSEGDCLDYGKSPFFFCDSCMGSEDHEKKLHSKPKSKKRQGAAQ